MKKSSIFFSITFIFAIALVGIFLAYKSMIDYDKQKYTHELNERYSIVSRVSLIKLLTMPVDEKFERDLKIYKMRVIKQDKLIKNVLKNGEVLQSISARIGRSTILYYNKSNYLLIESPTNKAVLLYDTAYKPYRTQIQKIKIIFGFIAILILFVYFWTIKKIKPIKKIKEEIDKFANGDLNINCKMDTNDEIAEVANAFNNAVMQIKKLNNSRKLFLRNIMHELKTPITKGRITAEMIEDGKNKQRLISVFDKLDELLQEFIYMEQITVDSSFIKKQIISIKEVVENSIKISMIDKKKIEVIYLAKYETKIDKKLFPITLKNLIDNAIKYSDDKRAKIIIDKGKIIVASKGERLKQDLSYYIEPFAQDAKNQNNGFGLGLYIVDNILKAHNMEFKYEYKNKENCFIIDNIMQIL